jgi:hypothetical protein
MFWDTTDILVAGKGIYSNRKDLKTPAKKNRGLKHSPLWWGFLFWK